MRAYTLVLAFLLGALATGEARSAPCPSDATKCPAPTYSRALVGAATGGLLSAPGSINAQAYYLNGVPFTGGGGGITQLTGDVTGAGTGSVATTLTTVNSSIGSFVNASITVNAKGLITAASNGSITGVTGPGTSTNLFVPQWNGTSGSALGAGLPVGATGVSTILQTGVGGLIASSVIPSINLAASGAGGVTGILPVASGGSGTATPSLVSGTNITITGSWPNQAINATSATFGNPTATAGPNANNGISTTAMRSDASPAIQLGSNVVPGLVKGDGATFTVVAGVGSSIGGAATSITAGVTTIGGGTPPCVISNPSGSVMSCIAETGTGSVVLATSPTLASPTVTGAFTATGLVSNADLTNSSMTIAGHVISLGGTQAIACADLSNGAAGCSTLLGTNVATALGVNVGSAGAFVVFGGAGGTPSSLVGTNITGTAAGLTAGTASAANALHSASTTVVVNGATAPTAGQVLTALSGAAADWETLSATATSVIPGTTTVVGATAPCVLSNPSSTAMACETETGTGSVVFSTSPTLVTPALGTPSTLFLTNATGLPIAGITGLGSNVGTALAIAVGSAGAFVTNGGALGTPSSGVGTNLTGTAASLTSGLTTAALGLKSATTTVSISGATAPTSGQILTATSGSAATWQTPANAISITPGTTTIVGATAPCVISNSATTVMNCIAETGTGSVVLATSPTLVTPALGTPSAAILTNATGLPVAGISGLGTGVAAALVVNVGSAGAPVLFNGAGGTPSSMTATNLTGTAASLTAGIATVANGLKSATTTVVVSAATAPTTGQVLTATGTTAATWQTPGATSISLTCATADLVCTPSPITGTGTIGSAVTVSAQSGSYAVVGADNTKVITGAVATTIAQAGTGLFVAGWGSSIVGVAAGTTTLTPTTSTIGGLTALALDNGQFASFAVDGSNYDVALGMPPTGTQNKVLATPNGSTGQPKLRALVAADLPNTAVSANSYTSANITVDAQGRITAAANGSASATSITPGTTTIVGSTAPCLIENSATTTMACAAVGTGVVTALGNNLSAAGGTSSTIASGTSAMGTGAISSAACATAVTTTATNTATTDVINWGFNGDPTGVTGYTPVTTGALTIFAYPSSNNVNFKVCNLTGSSITPGAITLNWRVVR